MEFNPGKCQVIRVTRARTPIPTQYTLHSQTLEVLPSARYLGVDIASDLSWKPHIVSITNSANKSLGFLRRNLKAKRPQLRGRAYKAIVRPSWNMLHQSGTLISKKLSRGSRWSTGGRLDGSRVITLSTLVFQTCWEDWTGALSNNSVLTHDWSFSTR